MKIFYVDGIRHVVDADDENVLVFGFNKSQGEFSEKISLDEFEKRYGKPVFSNFNLGELSSGIIEYDLIEKIVVNSKQGYSSSFMRSELISVEFSNKLKTLNIITRKAVHFFNDCDVSIILK